MESKRFVRKWEHQEMNGTWFYLLKWHFIYALLLFPVVTLINNFGLLQNSGNFATFFVNLELSRNSYLTYGLINGIAISASFLRWKILEAEYYRLKIKSKSN